MIISSTTYFSLSCIIGVTPYLWHASQLCLYVQYLVGFKPQGCKHKQEQEQHGQGQTGADSHATPTLPTTPHPLLGRWEGPAGNEVWRLARVLWTSIHKKHLWKRIALVTAHGVGPTVRRTLCIYLPCMKEVCTYLNTLVLKKSGLSCQDIHHPQISSHTCTKVYV